MFARPNRDIANSGWFTSYGPYLYEKINSEPAADGDYIVCFSYSTFTVGLSSLVNPNTSFGHILHYRLNWDGGSCNNEFKIELLQGNKLICSFYHKFGLSNSGFKQFNQTLSCKQAQLITDYGDLRVRVTFIPSGKEVAAYISWIALEIPDEMIVSDYCTNISVRPCDDANCIMNFYSTIEGRATLEATFSTRDALANRLHFVYQKDFIWSAFVLSGINSIKEEANKISYCGCCYGVTALGTSIAVGPYSFILEISLEKPHFRLSLTYQENQSTVVFEPTKSDLSGQIIFKRHSK